MVDEGIRAVSPSCPRNPAVRAIFQSNVRRRESRPDRRATVRRGGPGGHGTVRVRRLSSSGAGIRGGENRHREESQETGTEVAVSVRAGRILWLKRREMDSV